MDSLQFTSWRSLWGGVGERPGVGEEGGTGTTNDNKPIQHSAAPGPLGTGTSTEPMTELLLGPGEGVDGNVFGLEMTRRVSGADTEGAFFAVEFELPPGEEIPPHIHFAAESIW